MRVKISDRVHISIREFYEQSLILHPSLEENVVYRKIDRLYLSMEALGDYFGIYPIARFRRDWQMNGYREFIVEDFHFAYRVETLETGENVVVIYDAVHSLLYHN